jgi:hypothetical protein
MHSMNKLNHLALTVILAFSFLFLSSQSIKITSRYRDYPEVISFAEGLLKAHPGIVKLHKIAVSPGGRDVIIIEIGAGLQQVPAIFAGANFEGNNPLATEGALRMAEMLIDSVGYRSKRKWFVLPMPNPDAAQGFFSAVKWERCVNDMKVNDDVDDQTDEDGSEDLNGDGLVTLMRAEDPEGNYLVSETDPRLMVKADIRKGERGKFKIYSEGIDNDQHGQYHEDGPGGINPGIGFPHLFKPHHKESGLWPGEAPEVYGLMDFIFSHPEIAMAFTLGSSDWCMNPPKSTRSGGASFESLKIPARYASRIGADPDKTYTMAQVMEMFKSFFPGVEASPEMIAGILGLGAVVNPLEDDLRFYTELSGKYNDYLKTKGFSTNRLSAGPDKDGSFETWAYYHLGIPSFSMNLFTIPKSGEEKPSGDSLSFQSIEKMTTDEFLALGEEKIALLLKSVHVPGKMDAARVLEMVKSGKFTPKQLAGMAKTGSEKAGTGEQNEREKSVLDYIDRHLKGQGFVNWQPFDHPELGKIEIGGAVPFVASTPPAEQIDSLCLVQLPWLLRLTEKLPNIGILKEEITPLGAGVYKLEIFIENKGYFAYPVAMGVRNRQPAPVVVILGGDQLELLEGFIRTPLGEIKGNQVKKLTWLLKADRKTEISATIESAVFGNSVRQIKIGG